MIGHNKIFMIVWIACSIACRSKINTTQQNLRQASTTSQTHVDIEVASADSNGEIKMLLTDQSLPSCDDAIKGATFYIVADGVFKYCDSNLWTLIDLKGTKGDKGDTGEKGEVGKKGSAGPTGVSGAQGVKGDTGAQGAIGPQGPGPSSATIQFITATQWPSNIDDAPTNPNIGARYYRSDTGFTWDWDISSQKWIPIPKVYRALMSQSIFGGNPTPIILENTLGSIAWSVVSTGWSHGELVGAFPSNLVFFNSGFKAATSSHFFHVSRVDSNTVNLNHGYIDGDGLVQAQDGFTNLPIEILVYPEYDGPI